MTSTDRLAEMAAEISRLRTKIVGLEAIVADNEARVANTHGMAAEIERLERDNDGLDEIIIDQARVIADLRARIAELELRLDIRRQAFSDVVQIAQTGTLAKPTPDEPATITHGHAPSAPPHDE